MNRRANDQLIDFNNGSDGMVQMQPQFTGMPQFNSFNPYAAAAAQQQAQQEEYMRMQQQLEMQRQMEQQAAYQQMMQQQAYLQQQQQQQQALQQQHTMQPLVPQPTAFGSNNPFAAFGGPPAASSPQPQFQSQTPPPPRQEAPSPAPVSNAPKRTNAADQQHAQLAAMLGSGGSGVDTFGNIGSLRIPVCVFGVYKQIYSQLTLQVSMHSGSPFHPSNRTGAGLQAQATGSNPFGAMQNNSAASNGFGNNFNGMNSSSMSRSSSGQQQQQQQQQQPAQPFFSI